MKTQTEVIDGVEYTTTTLPATQGLIILPKLVNLVGEDGIALLMATSNEEQESLMENSTVAVALMANVASRASEDDGLLVLKDLLQATTFKKQIGSNTVEAKVLESFDEHFAGRYMHLINVAIWVGRASFGQP